MLQKHRDVLSKLAEDGFYGEVADSIIERIYLSIPDATLLNSPRQDKYEAVLDFYPVWKSMH